MWVEIKNINKSFGDKIIFSDFNLEIESESIVIISGESGSGKTTLLNIIGTIEDYEGTILYDGKRLKNKKEILRMRRDELSFIFQNYGLIENETVYENFKVIQNYKNNKHRIKEVLSMVGLQGFGTRKVFELSGGEQQQRAAISKAIFKNASLILADEPTASIDDKNKHIVIELFKNINKQGKTIIIVTHDLDLYKNFDNPMLVFI